MDPTHKKQLKSSPSSTTTKPHHQPTHPFSDPTTTTPIQKYISHHFSKPCANHKKLASLISSSRHSKKSQLDTNFQAKYISVPSVLDTSCTTLTKSKSQNERNHVFEESNTRTKVKEKFKNISEIKKPSKKEVPKKSSYESELMPTSLLESEQIMKRSQQGYEMRRSSISSLPMNGGTRRSFCSSHVELADFLSCNGVKVVAVDMPPFMQIHAVDCARKTHDSLEKFTSKTLALALKKEFDGIYGPAWHCIVGTGFGSFVTHSVGGFIYFSMDHKLYVLLFKTTVQRAV